VSFMRSSSAGSTGWPFSEARPQIPHMFQSVRLAAR
jgi:hypothetical protein